MLVTNIHRALAACLVICVSSSFLATTGQDREPRRIRTLGGLPDWARESWILRRQAEAPWALTGGTLVDVQSGELREGVNILVVGDRIDSVGPEPVPEGVETVDATGKYVIPGLMDLHAHVIPRTLFLPQAKDPEETLEILLHHGITTIRALPFYSESSLGWAAAVQAGRLTGPTLVTASSIFEKEAQRTSRGFGDAATAVRWVRKEALLGTRWIKVYNAMDPDSLRAIVDTAREYGMRVCGHTEDVPPREASELGIGTIEHMISIPLSCQRAGSGDPDQGGLAERTVRRWEQVDPARARELIDTFRVNGTGWVPTLVVSEKMLTTGVHDGVQDRGFDPSDDERLTPLRQAAELAVHMHRAGGLVGTGTDFPVDGVVAGDSLHRELELLVEFGGATPLEALQMATVSSARILGFGELLGRVEEDMLADFVLLAANPLEDISAVRQVELVVHQGRRHRR